MQVFAHRLFRLPFGLAAFSAIMYRTTECRNVRYNYPDSLVQGVAELLPDHPRLVKAAQQGSPHLGEYLSNLIAFPGGDIGGYYPDDVPALRREYKEKVERRRAKLSSLDLIPQIYQLYLDWFGFLDSLPYKQEDFEKNFGRHFPFKGEMEYRELGEQLLKFVSPENPFRLDLERNPQDSRYIISWLDWRMIFLAHPVMTGEEREIYSRERMHLSCQATNILK